MLKIETGGFSLALSSSTIRLGGKSLNLVLSAGVYSYQTTARPRGMDLTLEHSRLKSGCNITERALI